MSAAQPATIAQKLKVLSEAYTKLKAQNTVLKRAVLDEQQQRAALEAERDAALDSARQVSVYSLSSFVHIVERTHRSLTPNQLSCACLCMLVYA